MSPSGDKTDALVPEAPDAGLMDSTTKAKYLATWSKYYDYRIYGYDHRARTFEWQLLSSRIIFFVVITLVFTGFYFAAVQFHTGLRSKNAKSNGGGEEVTELSLSAKGITVSSPVLGVIVLVISMAFFYLYLVYVYPIVEIF